MRVSGLALPYSGIALHQPEPLDANQSHRFRKKELECKRACAAQGSGKNKISDEERKAGRSISGCIGRCVSPTCYEQEYIRKVIARFFWQISKVLLIFSPGIWQICDPTN